MKLKITCKGAPETAEVVNAETGEELENVIGVEISIDAYHADAAILIKNADIDIDQMPVIEEVVGGDTTGND